MGLLGSISTILDLFKLLLALKKFCKKKTESITSWRKS